MDIFVFGSCRVLNSAFLSGKYTVHRTPEYIHTTREVLQYLRSFEDPSVILGAAHPELIVGDLEACRADFENGAYSKQLAGSVMAIVEIGALCAVSDERNCYQLNLIWELQKSGSNPALSSSLTRSMISENDLVAEIREILARIGRPVLFVSHLNFDSPDLSGPGWEQKKKTREEIDLYLERAKDLLGINVLKPADVFKGYDCRSVLQPGIPNHYNESGEKIMAEALFESIERIARSAREDVPSGFQAPA